MLVSTFASRCWWAVSSLQCRGDYLEWASDAFAIAAWASCVGFDFRLVLVVLDSSASVGSSIWLFPVRLFIASCFAWPITTLRIELTWLSFRCVMHEDVSGRAKLVWVVEYRHHWDVHHRWYVWVLIPVGWLIEQRCVFWRSIGRRMWMNIWNLFETNLWAWIVATLIPVW